MRSANWYEMIVEGKARSISAHTDNEARRECRKIVNAENIEADYHIKHSYSSGIVRFINI